MRLSLLLRNSLDFVNSPDNLFVDEQGKEMQKRMISEAEPNRVSLLLAALPPIALVFLLLGFILLMR